MLTKSKEDNMANDTDQHKKSGLNAVPLAEEIRATLPTNEAAYHLHREQQTMRIWACQQNGPIQPIRINGRLAWPTDAIRKLLGG
jgi:hypothetical protein